ncbi:MAG: hypothetical protein HY365_03110 [Candidatus Aenigmarchaeota archaeon]|nr:hypothetical protein [Candidatus Aenigmarchaeota archaeon]
MAKRRETVSANPETVAGIPLSFVSLIVILVKMKGGWMAWKTSWSFWRCWA